MYLMIALLDKQILKIGRRPFYVEDLLIVLINLSVGGILFHWFTNGLETYHMVLLAIGYAILLIMVVIVTIDEYRGNLKDPYEWGAAVFLAALLLVFGIPLMWYDWTKNPEG